MQNRRGFSLIELTISMVMLLFITGAAVKFLRTQTSLVASTTAKMDALQNASFAGTQIERELREAGAGVVDGQPMLVQIDSEAITFNANMVSIDSGDMAAVYQSRDADTNGVRVMWKSERRLMPNQPSTTFSYPDTTYMSGAVPSGAETISYYFRPDSTTSGISNDYLLMRRVNGRPATLVARGIAKDPRDTFPFFTYYKADSSNVLKQILESKMPLFHTAVIHGSPADTLKSAQTDSVQAVRIHFLAAARDARTGKDALRSVEIMVRLSNSGLLHFATCGIEPLPAVAPTLTSNLAFVNPKWVKLTWTASPDDNMAGEHDIERYAIFRKTLSTDPWGDPIVSIMAGQTSYTYIDYAVVPGASYIYGVAPQDCTPAMAQTINQSASVTVKN